MTLSFKDLIRRLLHQQPLVLLAVVIGAALLVYYGVLAVQLVDGYESNSAIRDQAQALQAMPPVPAGGEGLEAALAEQQATLAVVREVFQIEHSDLLIQVLADKAAEAGVELLTVSVLTPALLIEDGFEFDSVPIGINVQGPLDSTLFFLDILQDALPVTRVDLADFGGMDTPQPFARLNLQFALDPVAIGGLGAVPSPAGASQ